MSPIMWIGHYSLFIVDFNKNQVNEFKLSQFKKIYVFIKFVIC